eukprot:364410-Chlamydomonas_euryale.AAC.13
MEYICLGDLAENALESWLAKCVMLAFSYIGETLQRLPPKIMPLAIAQHTCTRLKPDFSLA